MDVDRLGAAFVEEHLHDFPGVSMPAVLVEGEDAVHLEATRMARAARRRCKGAVDKDAEYPLPGRIGLLAAVVYPDLLCKWELFMFQFTDLFCHCLPRV